MQVPQYHINFSHKLKNEQFKQIRKMSKVYNGKSAWFFIIITFNIVSSTVGLHVNVNQVKMNDLTLATFWISFEHMVIYCISCSSMLKFSKIGNKDFFVNFDILRSLFTSQRYRDWRFFKFFRYYYQILACDFSIRKD